MFVEMVTGTFGLRPLLYVAAGLLAVWWFLKTKLLLHVPANIPPFPARPYPVVGNLFMLQRDALGTLMKWRQKSGDIFSMIMGQKLVVVISSFELLKDALVKNGDHFSDRPVELSNADPRFKGGVLDTSGALWREQRSVATMLLKDFGMGKNWIGDRIAEEVAAYLDSVAAMRGEPRELSLLTNAAVANVICAILVGHRFDYDDPYFCRLLSLANEETRIMQGTSVLKYFPWLKHLPGDLFKAKRFLEIEEEFRMEFSKKYIKKLRANSNAKEPSRTLINAYLKEEKKRKDAGQNTSLNEQNLTMVITNLFQAGSETTSTTLLWVMLFAIHFPQAQEKVYEEIKEVVGTERAPTLQDKPHLNYCHAFIMECQRLGNIGPLSLPHLCTRDTTIGGYTVPAGCTVLPHLKAILHDERIWGDPMAFRPERFLDRNDNSIVVPEQFIPFGIGRRYCMGKSLAEAELFMFVTGIFQRFHMRPDDPDNLPTFDPIFGVTCAPKPYKLRLLDRIQLPNGQSCSS